ncbi:MAG: sigma-54-dependent Fis family transcriptional regulator [Acidobacteria bacterium]|nr:sigma-54-dependent Fis family transcriptional regulator [Acidobacteriota bacterium]
MATVKPSILVVDDDASVTMSLSMLLKREGFAVHTAHQAAEACEIIEHHKVDLVIQDMNFTQETTGIEGMQLLAELKAHSPDLPIILMTAWGSIDLAVRGMKAGARDFITKPWDNRQLMSVVRTSLCLNATHPTTQMTREELDEHYDFNTIVGEDPQLLRVLETIGRVAATDASVLVLGESGTGKEAVAQAIHANSKRRSKPFIKVNLGGVSSALFESEMFGHVRGAFTDAKTDRLGRFQMAHGGSIFLDEIGDLDLASQVKLLRVLSERNYEPLGSSKSVRADVRVVAATNRDLAAMVAEGSFREDLLYRINLITVNMPPLRKRSGDIALLARHFLANAAQSHGLGQTQLDGSAVSWLKQQTWPGNIRELKQTMERVVLMTGKTHIGVQDLEAVASSHGTTSKPGLPTVGEMTLDEIEIAMIDKALKHHDGNVSRAAKSLGLSRAALYRRIEKHGLHI